MKISLLFSFYEHYNCQEAYFGCYVKMLMALIGDVKKYLTYHYFGIPRHTQPMIAYIVLWLGISGNPAQNLCMHEYDLNFMGYHNDQQSAHLNILLLLIIWWLIDQSH